ncbi:hypothetical protein F5887DRAFT_982809 [Amanita rubescens]|nr:hypothetical protein F5887DRAFT_982809 [Amanita rubescens]
MANRRLSTVYDYASLRLHRDGTRVQQSDNNYNLRKRRQFAVKDANGNWIATDAGGLGIVHGTRYIPQGTDEGREYGSLGNSEEQVEKGNERVLIENERKQKKALSRKDPRIVKRQRFNDETLEFLDVLHASSSYSNQTQEPCLAVPSSELLKAIHYFTASVYTNRRELLDLAKVHREERKSKEMSKIKTGGHQQDSDRSTLKSKASPYRQAKTLRDIRRKHQQDMYKVMDGSALIALGMLLQEHVARLVQGQGPEGRQEEIMTEMFGLVEDED